METGQRPFRLSLDKRSVATLMRQGSRVAVAVDGKPGPPLDSVSFDKTIVFSPRGGVT